MGTAPCPVPALGELVGHAVDEGLSYLYSVGNTGKCSTDVALSRVLVRPLLLDLGC